MSQEKRKSLQHYRSVCLEEQGEDFGTFLLEQGTILLIRLISDLFRPQKPHDTDNVEEAGEDLGVLRLFRNFWLRSLSVLLGHGRVLLIPALVARHARVDLLLVLNGLLPRDFPLDLHEDGKHESHAVVEVDLVVHDLVELSRRVPVELDHEDATLDLGVVRGLRGEEGVHQQMNNSSRDARTINL